MKKTLIALAVAASAAVSGSAMAWEANGSGGSVNIGGSLTPAENITPWEVKTGAAVTGLDADIIKGQSVINIAVDQAIPVLGIRTHTGEAFVGRTGVAPNIDYKGAIDINQFNDGVTDLNLTVNDKDSGDKIGTLTTKLSAGALYSWSSVADSNRGGFFSLGGVNKSTELFNGGLSGTIAGAMSVAVLESKADNLFPGSMDNFNTQGFHENSIYWTGVEDVDSKHSAFYAAGIEQSKVIKITLDAPAQGDAPIKWKASLPVTVSYQ
ncbi:hypothetical protein [Escherichia coli]|uniref:F4 family fimbrial subunit n=1 Tax=Escherichia coli TaxID=562 RepID=UPI000CFAC30C|nr:hypothetical protein [Escherichia coli]